MPDVRLPFSYRTLAGLGVVVVAMLLGVAIGIGPATTPVIAFPVAGKGTPASRSSSSTSPRLTPSARSTATALLKPGRLGDHVRLASAGGQVVATGSGGIFESSDGGVTWASPALPGGAAGLVLNPVDPRHRLAGGGTLEESHDSGATWQPVRTQPPGPGPFTPLLISRNDPGVWFVVAHGALLRTRDSAVSWRSMTGLPAMNGAVMTWGGGSDRFFLTAAGRVFDLVDNGNQLHERPALPAGSAAEQLVAAGSGPTLLARTADGRVVRDGGQGWQPNSHDGSLSSAAGGRVFVADAGSTLGVMGAVNVSDDGGATWYSGSGFPPAESIEAVVALEGDGNQALAYGYGGDLFKTTDAGVMWSQVSTTLRTA